jgi:SAM-dependent methyltransferase
MIHQRAIGAAPAIRAMAEALPFADSSFDAVLGVLTMHHWSDVRKGIRECRRVARDRVVFLTWDPASSAFWLEHYFPDLLNYDRTIFPSLDLIGEHFPTIDVRAVPVPHDCIDGFLGAFWRRPEEYLDEGVRSRMSSFSRVGDVRGGLEALGHDLVSGRWSRWYCELLDREQLDLGYRIVVGLKS